MSRKMAQEWEITDEAEKSVMKDGVYRIPNSNAIFIDAVPLLNTFYHNFSISPSHYYHRSIPFNHTTSISKPASQSCDDQSTRPNKKRKGKSSAYFLNSKELLAQQRHQEARPFILSAYEAFVKDPSFPTIINCLANYRKLESLEDNVEEESNPSVPFVELRKLFQAPLYEISISKCIDDGGKRDHEEESSPIPLFNSLLENKTDSDAVANILSSSYIIPRQSSFLVSDLSQIDLLVPDSSSDGYTVIMIDPPWENKSVHRQSLYPTLPNKYLLSIPVARLAHSEGSIVALWVTNREKLRSFVDNELFPHWGVRFITSFYWLKITEKGEILSELDSCHHKPYECLLLGYITRKDSSFVEENYSNPPANKVIISVPGEHSRKPPIGNLLLDYAPKIKPLKCLELFARELMPGWTSWGNEPLLFQHSKNFITKK